MLTQIRGMLQKVSLPESWASTAFIQLDKWDVEEQGKLQSFAQKQAKTLFEIQSKLDKLVNGFLG